MPLWTLKQHFLVVLHICDIHDGLSSPIPDASVMVARVEIQDRYSTILLARMSLWRSCGRKKPSRKRKEPGSQWTGDTHSAAAETCSHEYITIQVTCPMVRMCKLHVSPTACKWSRVHYCPRAHNLGAGKLV